MLPGRTLFSYIQLSIKEMSSHVLLSVLIIYSRPFFIVCYESCNGTQMRKRMETME